MHLAPVKSGQELLETTTTTANLRQLPPSSPPPTSARTRSSPVGTGWLNSIRLCEKEQYKRITLIRLGSGGGTIMEGYGEISGSAPNWHLANMHDRGRTHLQMSSQLGDMGLEKWNQAVAPPNRALRRLFEQPQPQSYGEPVIKGGNIPASYYARRANSADNPSAFRRSLRPIADPGTLRMDRAEGKRYLPEPHGNPPHPTGPKQAPDEVRFREPGRLPEPALPRLARPPVSGLRESDNELSHEQALGRKVRVDQQSYRGLGRAGDLSTATSAPLQPDYADPSFFKTLKDTPTFIRFCSTLPPKPPVSPHERRALELQRIQEQDLKRDRQLVNSLQLEEDNT